MNGLAIGSCAASPGSIPRGYPPDRGWQRRLRLAGRELVVRRSPCSGPTALAAAIRTRVQAGTNPIPTTVFFYRFNPEAMDPQTRDLLLDTLAEQPSHLQYQQ